MNNSLKLTTAALLVFASTQASATDFELDISNTITQSVKSYVQQASNELKQSVMNSIEFDAQKLLDTYMSEDAIASKEEGVAQVLKQQTSSKEKTMSSEISFFYLWLHRFEFVSAYASIELFRNVARGSTSKVQVDITFHEILIGDESARN